MTLRRTGIRRTGGPRRHQGLRQRSRKQARRDRAFQHLKPVVFRRDAYRCRRCLDGGDYATLDAHHMLPRAHGGKDELTNLVTLCRPCHDVVHREPQAAYEHGWLVRSGGGT